MKRIALWFMSTTTVLVLLFGYRTSLAGPTRLQTVASSPKPVTTTSTETSGAGTGTGSSGSSSGSSSSSSSSSSSGSSGSSASTSKTVTGSAVDTRWGPVQVQLTIANNKITDVQVVQYPSNNPRDIEINNYALPVLVQETQTAQSANIQMVTGATVTSTGYIQSLQSALDQAGL